MLYGWLGSVTLLGDAKGVSFYTGVTYYANLLTYSILWRIKMQHFIGTKLVKAVPMTRIAYNEYRGWKLPVDELHLAEEQGFLVEYVDGGRANDARHTGYISWSPADVFAAAYKTSGSLSFGDAVIVLKQGKQIARKGWNGRGMYIRYVPATPYLNAHLELKNVANTYDTWVPSVSDVLAEDWCIVE